MKKFLERIKSLPEPMQRQIWLRFGLGAALFLFGPLSAIAWRDWTMLVILAVAVFCAALGIRIAYREFVVITGICGEVESTVIRKRSKAILLITEIGGKEAMLRIPLRQQFRKFTEGELLEVYVDAAASIHEWDGKLQLQSYIAIDKRGAV